MKSLEDHDEQPTMLAACSHSIRRFPSTHICGPCITDLPAIANTIGWRY
jgi:hypothetical protein